MIEIKNYTQDQLNYIIDNYNNKTVKEISNKLNKTYDSVSFAIRKLGLVKQVHNKWSNDEISFLKENYINMTSEEISKHVNHSIDAINSMRDRLGLVRNSTWTQKELDYLLCNYKSMSHNEIGKVLNKSAGAINAKCFELGLYKKELPWTEQELDYIKQNYMNKSTSEIASELHRTKNAVKLKAERMGMKKYPYICDYHYFDNIDTEEKAYWLGFLMADGWISRSDKTNSCVVGLELQYGDIGHLRKFNKSINGNYNIVDTWKKCPISTNPNKFNHLCSLRIFSVHMFESLKSLGFSKDKTYSCSIPSIDNELLRHFIRGYYDGDGILCFTNKSFHVDFITASNSLFNDIKQILFNNNFKFSFSSYDSNYGTRTYRIYINKNADKVKFLDWIYECSNIYLDRKYKKYLKVKQKYTEQNNDYLAS